MDTHGDSDPDCDVYSDVHTNHSGTNGYSNSQAYEHADYCASNSHGYLDLHPDADYRGANSDSYPNRGEALQGA